MQVCLRFRANELFRSRALIEARQNDGPVIQRCNRRQRSCVGRGAYLTLRLPLPINRALILQGLALLAFAVVVGIFMHSIISLLVG